MFLSKNSNKLILIKFLLTRIKQNFSWKLDFVLTCRLKIKYKLTVMNSIQKTNGTNSDGGSIYYNSL